jgi:hypothetical protein
MQGRPYVRSTADEQALGGEVIMLTEKDRVAIDGPQQQVTISKPFAVSEFELIFSEPATTGRKLRLVSSAPARLCWPAAFAAGSKVVIGTERP